METDQVIDLNAARKVNKQVMERRRLARTVSGLGWPVAGGAILAASGYGMFAPLVLAVGVPSLIGMSTKQPVNTKKAVIDGLAMVSAFRIIEGRVKKPWYKK